jgi:hypothetical protein
MLAGGITNLAPKKSCIIVFFLTDALLLLGMHGIGKGALYIYI